MERLQQRQQLHGSCEDDVVPITVTFTDDLGNHLTSVMQRVGK